MSNLVYTNNLIERALRTVRAQSQFQDDDPQYREDALKLLNEILAELNESGMLIPFETIVPFTLQTGKSVYTVGNLIGNDILSTPFTDFLDFNLTYSSIRYPILMVDDFAVLGHATSLINQARPGCVRIERFEDYSSLEFLPVPDQDYAATIRGKTEIGEVAYNNYITLPDWYARFLRLALAREINDYFDLKTWDQSSESRYLQALNGVRRAAKRDLAVRTEQPYRLGRQLRSNYLLGVIEQ